MDAVKQCRWRETSRSGRPRQPRSTPKTCKNDRSPIIIPIYPSFMPSTIASTKNLTASSTGTRGRCCDELQRGLSNSSSNAGIPKIVVDGLVQVTCGGDLSLASSPIAARTPALLARSPSAGAFPFCAQRQSASKTVVLNRSPNSPALCRA